MAEELKVFEADWYGDFHYQAWDRDKTFEEISDGRYYLDKVTGTLFWIFTDGWSMSEEEVQSVEAKIASSPDRFVLVPPPTHATHHEVFREFRETLPEEVRALCNPESIGGFLDDAEHYFPGEDWRGRWRGHWERAVRNIANQWYAEQGIRYVWK